MCYPFNYRMDYIEIEFVAKPRVYLFTCMMDPNFQEAG